MNEHLQSAVNDWSPSLLVHEIAVTHAINADRETVFSAWTDPGSDREVVRP